MSKRKKRIMTLTERILAETYNEIKSLSQIIKKSEDMILDVYSITIPEDGDTQTFDAGTTGIDLKLGVITNPDSTIEQLNRALDAYQPKDLLHSLSIATNKEIKYSVDNGSYYTIKKNVSMQLPNVSYRTITIICTESTEISLFCSTNPGAVQKTHSTPVGDQNLQFSQCSHGKLRTLDAFHYQIEHGDRDTKVGYDSAVTEANFEVLANANFSQPAGDIQMEVVSDNVGDDSVGAGAQLVRITYFNVAWVKKTTDVIMDGTTIVDTTATDIYRIETFEVIKGSPAIGTITLKSTDAATLYGQIEPLTTFMERAMHYIETGHRCVVSDAVLSTQTKEGVIFRIFKTVIIGDNQVTRGRYSVSILETVVPLEFNVPVVVENPDGERMAVGIAVRGLAAAQGASGSFRYYCEEI